MEKSVDMQILGWWRCGLLYANWGFAWALDICGGFQRRFCLRRFRRFAPPSAFTFVEEFVTTPAAATLIFAIGPADKLAAGNCQFDGRSVHTNRNRNGAVALANPITSGPPTSGF